MRTNERGAIIIHVAFALMALLCFSAIVLDQGVFFVARRQAQNAADAGALAGAITLMLDRTRTAEATTAAQDFARKNVVWGQGTVNADITVSPLPFNCRRRCSELHSGRRITWTAQSPRRQDTYEHYSNPDDGNRQSDESGGQGDGHRADRSGQRRRVHQALGGCRSMDGQFRNRNEHEWLGPDGHLQPGR